MVRNTLVGLLAYLIFSPAFSTLLAAYPFTGTFMFHDHIPDANGMKQYFDNIQSIGMDTVITGPTYITFSACDSTDPDVNWNYSYYADLYNKTRDYSGNRVGEKFDLLFAEAEKRNMNVYIGLSGVEFACGVSDGTPLMNKTIEFTKHAVDSFLIRYGNKKSFKGWYFGDEPFLKVAHTNNAYFVKVTKAIKDTQAARGFQKPILFSPYIADWQNFGNAQTDPVTFGQWVKSFMDQTGLDTVLVQDSVGGGNISVYNDTTYKISDYFREIAGRVGKDRVWSDNELYMYCNTKSGEPSCFNDTSIPAMTATSLTRVSKQVDLTSMDYVTKRVVWIADYHLLPSDAFFTMYRGPEKRLYASYVAKYGNGGTSILKPSSYIYEHNSPKPQYPDTGTKELFDSELGNPDKINNSNWVGTIGSTDYVFKFPGTVQVDWVGFNLLNKSASGIFFPTSLELYCFSPTTNNYVSMGVYKPKVKRHDGVYVFSNSEKITKNNQCTSVKAILYTGANEWIFTDEAEIVGKSVGGSEPPPKSSGDLNDDKKIDNADLNLFIASFGITGAGIKADFNNDQKVDVLDYSIMTGNYGK